MYPKRKKLQKPLRSTLRWCSYDIWSIESAGFTSKYFKIISTSPSIHMMSSNS